MIDDVTAPTLVELYNEIRRHEAGTKQARQAKAAFDRYCKSRGLNAYDTFRATGRFIRSLRTESEPHHADEALFTETWEKLAEGESCRLLGVPAVTFQKIAGAEVRAAQGKPNAYSPETKKRYLIQPDREVVPL